jgi:hypothetical protein
VLPEHTGLLLAAKAKGAAFIVTFTDVEEEHPPLVTITVYNPVAAVVTLLIPGFCCVELNPFGPDHEYEVAPPGPELKLSVLPAQTGLLLDAVAFGAEFTSTVVNACAVHPAAFVTVTVYVPACSEVTFTRVGFCCMVEYAFGPLHE